MAPQADLDMQNKKPEYPVCMSENLEQVFGTPCCCFSEMYK